MYLIIAGAGRTGKRVIELAVKDDHHVVAIEESTPLTEEISSEFRCRVVNEDASENGVPEMAGIDEADALVATINNDAVNLILMMIGHRYGVPKLLSTLNNLNHIKLYRKLTGDFVKNPYQLLGEHFYRNVQEASVKDFVKLSGGAELIELKLDKRSPVIGKTILEVLDDGHITEDVIIVSIYRNGDLIIPHGDTQFKIGDAVAVLSKHEIDRDSLKL